jgi:hypothetical protein
VLEKKLCTVFTIPCRFWGVSLDDGEVQGPRAESLGEELTHVETPDPPLLTFESWVLTWASTCVWWLGSGLAQGLGWPGETGATQQRQRAGIPAQKRSGAGARGFPRRETFIIGSKGDFGPAPASDPVKEDEIENGDDEMDDDDDDLDSPFPRKVVFTALTG